MDLSFLMTSWHFCFWFLQLLSVRTHGQLSFIVAARPYSFFTLFSVAVDHCCPNTLGSGDLSVSEAVHLMSLVQLMKSTILEMFG